MGAKAIVNVLYLVSESFLLLKRMLFFDLPEVRIAGIMLDFDDQQLSTSARGREGYGYGQAL